MPIALNYLRCERRAFQAEMFADELLDSRIDVRVRPDRARQFPDRNDFFRPLESIDIAFDLRAPQQQFQSERHRLGVNAMRPTHARRFFEFDRAASQHFPQFSQQSDQNVRRLFQHQTNRRVFHVARGQAFVDVLRRLADVLGNIRQKRYDVMVRLALDFMNALDGEVCLGFYVFECLRRSFAELDHCLECRDLDLQDRRPLVSLRPQFSHFRAYISFDHMHQLLQY